MFLGCLYCLIWNYNITVTSISVAWSKHDIFYFFCKKTPASVFKELFWTRVFYKISVRRSKLHGDSFKFLVRWPFHWCTTYIINPLQFFWILIFDINFHAPSNAVFRRKRKPKIFGFKTVTEIGSNPKKSHIYLYYLATHCI